MYVCMYLTHSGNSKHTLSLSGLTFTTRVNTSYSIVAFILDGCRTSPTGIAPGQYQTWLGTGYVEAALACLLIKLKYTQ